MKDSPLKRFWRVIYPLGLYILIQVIMVFAVEMVSFAALMAKNTSLGKELNLVQLAVEVSEILAKYTYEITVASALITLPFLILFYRMDKKRKKAEGTLATYEKVPAWQYLLTIGLGIAICVAGNNIITFSGLMQISDSYGQVAEHLYQGRLIFELLGIGLLIPATEEMIFRGLIYSRFREFASPIISGVVTSLAFAIFHGNLVQGVYAFFLGAALCFVSERYHSFWAPYAIHAAANLVSVIGSEVKSLDIFFQEGPVFYAATLICSLLVVLFMYLIDKQVNSRRVE